MNTPMEMNFKKLCGDAARLVLANPFEYRQLIGALMFLANTRPDIYFEVNTLSQYMIKPSHAQWIAAKHVLRYLHGTINLRLRDIVGDVRLHGKSELDWVGKSSDRKSTYGCCFSLGSAMVSWMSRKQKFAALSMAEVEYVATSMASC